MSDSIRLSPKHGVNPAIPKCFFCGEDKNEILLPGMLKGDVEAPKNMVWDKNPCDQCRAHMARGVILISVDEAKSDDKQNPYRTGGFAVVTDAAIERIVQPKEFADQILQQRIAFLPDEVWDRIGLPRPDQN